MSDAFEKSKKRSTNFLRLMLLELIFILFSLISTYRSCFPQFFHIFNRIRCTKQKFLSHCKLHTVICNYTISVEIIYVFLTIFLYLLKCPQSLILSALRAFCFCGKPHISRSIFLYFRYQAWLKSW